MTYKAITSYKNEDNGYILVNNKLTCIYNSELPSGNIFYCSLKSTPFINEASEKSFISISPVFEKITIASIYLDESIFEDFTFRTNGRWIIGVNKIWSVKYVGQDFKDIILESKKLYPLLNITDNHGNEYICFWSYENNRYEIEYPATLNNSTPLPNEIIDRPELWKMTKVERHLVDLVYKLIKT